jgi:ParB-like chromosome segregation protein Spo0J
MLISQIKPNPNNPRKISKSEFERLVKSIQEDQDLLEAKPIIIDENNVILAGHQRYKACLQLGIQDVPVKIMANLSERKKQKLLVIDNTHNGEFDMDILANENWDLHDLADWGVNLDFFIPTIEEPQKIDNTKKGKVCPNCGVSL